MYHEKTIIRDNGDKISIRVTFWISSDKPTYSIDLALCPKGKRKFIYLNLDNFEYRKLSLEDRTNYRNEKFLNHVSLEEILEAKKELWKKLSPL